MKQIVNVESGEVSVEPFSEVELKEIEKIKKANEAASLAQAQAAAAKAALLEKLGITEDEAKLLLS